MRERALNLYAHEVRAVLEGRQTQVRRVVKGVPSGAVSAGVITSSTNAASEGEWWWLDAIDLMDAGVVGDSFRCPYGQPGDRLWGRETFAIGAVIDGRCSGNSFVHLWDGAQKYRDGAYYRPDNHSRWNPQRLKWKPSTHMPRWASRIDLEVTGCRVERLQDISEEDCWAEAPPGLSYPIRSPSDFAVTEGGRQRCYQRLWESIHGPGIWGANPFVWVVEFKRDQGGRPQC